MKRSRLSRHEIRVRHAFPLIELIVALAGGAIILSAIYGVFSRAVHLRDEATARTREARVRAHALSVLRNDLRNAWLSGGTLAAVFEGSQKSQSGGFPGYLKFIATTSPDDTDEPAGELQQVEYYITADPAATDQKAGLLVRTVDRDLLATVRQTPAEEPLLGGVESMEVSFFDGESWQDTWICPDDDMTPPQAVRVRLQTTDAAVPFELMVPWMTQPSMAQATQ